jgi:hypothetical protein
MDIGNMPGIVEYTRKKNEKRRNMLTKRFCKNEPNCVMIKQNLQNKEQKKYEALKKAVESEECVRCERKFRDIRSHAPRCEATIPFLKEQDEKIKQLQKKYPGMERVRPGWITRRDTKKFAKKAKMIDEEKQKEEDKKWEERYKSRWEGSRGCFPKKFTDAVSKRTKDEKTAKKYI